MQRLHPEFIKINPDMTDQQLVEEFLDGAKKGTEYWANTINETIGDVSPLETPAIIAALHIVADAYGKLAPGSEDAAKEICNLLNVCAFVTKEKEHA